MNYQELAKAEGRIKKLINSTYVDDRDIPENTKGHAISDGVVNPELYLKASRKIMWVLKEPWCGKNDSGGGWSLIDLLANRPVTSLKPSTFYPISYINYGILNYVKKYSEIPDIHQMECAENYFRSMAFINVKKLPGARWGAMKKRVEYWYDKGAHIIEEQIETYKPNIIIGCAPHMRKLMKRRGITDSEISVNSFVESAKINDQIYLKTYHPAQTKVSWEIYINTVLEVIDSYGEILH